MEDSLPGEPERVAANYPDPVSCQTGSKFRSDQEACPSTHHCKRDPAILSQTDRLDVFQLPVRQSDLLPGQLPVLEPVRLVSSGTKSFFSVSLIL